MLTSVIGGWQDSETGKVYRDASDAWKDTTPKYAGFTSLYAATAWRSMHGGWLFVADTGDNVIWFDTSHTPTPVMLHPATHGLSGKLI